MNSVVNNFKNQCREIKISEEILVYFSGFEAKYEDFDFSSVENKMALN